MAAETADHNGVLTFPPSNNDDEREAIRAEGLDPDDLPMQPQLICALGAGTTRGWPLARHMAVRTS